MDCAAAFPQNIRHYSLEVSPLCGIFQGRASEGLDEGEEGDMQQHFWATFKTSTSRLYGAFCASTNRHKVCFINKKRRESNISGSYWELFNTMQNFSRCSLVLFDTKYEESAFSMQGGAALYLWFFLLSGSGVMLIPHLGLSKQPHQISEEDVPGIT